MLAFITLNFKFIENQTFNLLVKLGCTKYVFIQISNLAHKKIQTTYFETFYNGKLIYYILSGTNKKTLLEISGRKILKE